MNVTLRREDRVGILTLDRPPANALDGELASGIERVLQTVERDPTVRVLLIASRVERFFMAGGDIKHYATLSPDGLVDTVRGYRALFMHLHRLPVPTIAVIDGYATGGGAELALACDLRVASERARIGVPEILIGGLPSAGGTQMLTRSVGYARAVELMLSGRSVGGEEAAAIGLATHFAVEDPIGVALSLAQEIAAKSPTAVRWIKRCARSAFDAGLFAGLDAEDVATVAVSETDEFWQEVRSFAEGRRRASGKS